MNLMSTTFWFSHPPNVSPRSLWHGPPPSVRKSKRQHSKNNSQNFSILGKILKRFKIFTQHEQWQANAESQNVLVLLTNLCWMPHITIPNYSRSLLFIKSSRRLSGMTVGSISLTKRNGQHALFVISIARSPLLLLPCRLRKDGSFVLTVWLRGPRGGHMW